MVGGKYFITLNENFCLFVSLLWPGNVHHRVGGFYPAEILAPLQNKLDTFKDGGQVTCRKMHVKTCGVVSSCNELEMETITWIDCDLNVCVFLAKFQINLQTK